MLRNSILVLVLVSAILLGETHDQAGAGTLSSEAPSNSTELQCPVGAPAENVLVEMIKEKFQPYVRSTERPITFYHYGWRSSRFPNGAPVGTYNDSVAVSTLENPNDVSGPLDPNPKFESGVNGEGLAQHYFRTKAGAFYQTRGAQGYIYGPGLYTATDPLDTLFYSGFPPVLLRVGIPAGTKYLDLRTSQDTAIASSEQQSKNLLCAARYYCSDGSCRDSLIKLSESWRQQKETGIFGMKFTDLLGSDGGTALIKKAFGEMQVGMIAGHWGFYQFPECKLNPELSQMTDAVFIEPDLAPKLDLKLIVMAVEKNPSTEKKRLYGEILDYFDAFDIDHPEGTRFSDGGHRDEMTQSFWEFYKAWAPNIRGLPEGTDLVRYQKEQHQKWVDQKTRNEQLTSKLFGCSSKHPEEYHPPK